MQETWVRSLIWQDPTFCRATKPLHHTIEPGLQSLGDTTTKPMCFSCYSPCILEPMFSNKKRHCNKSMHCSKDACHKQIKAHTATKTIVINKEIKLLKKEKKAAKLETIFNWPQFQTSREGIFIGSAWIKYPPLSNKVWEARGPRNKTWLHGTYPITYELIYKNTKHREFPHGLGLSSVPDGELRSFKLCCCCCC